MKQFAIFWKCIRSIWVCVFIHISHPEATLCCQQDVRFQLHTNIFIFLCCRLYPKHAESTSDKTHYNSDCGKNSLLLFPRATVLTKLPSQTVSKEQTASATTAFQDQSFCVDSGVDENCFRQGRPRLGSPLGHGMKGYRSWELVGFVCFVFLQW